MLHTPPKPAPGNRHRNPTHPVRRPPHIITPCFFPIRPPHQPKAAAIRNHLMRIPSQILGNRHRNPANPIRRPPHTTKQPMMPPPAKHPQAAPKRNHLMTAHPRHPVPDNRHPLPSFPIERPPHTIQITGTARRIAFESSPEEIQRLRIIPGRRTRTLSVNRASIPAASAAANTADTVLPTVIVVVNEIFPSAPTVKGPVPATRE